MTYDNETPPEARKFKCGHNMCAGSIWSIFPDAFYREPERKIKDNSDKLETTAQCPKCLMVNTVYWYRPKIF